MRTLLTVFAIAALTPALTACDLGGGERPVALPDTSDLSSTVESRLPQGFTLATGRGGIRDLTVSDTTDGVQVITFATIGSPRIVTQFYRAEATAAGMTYAGQMDAGDMIATNFARTTAAPRRLSVSVSDEGAFVNISLTFNAE